jgi:hypothetical protein
MGQDRIVRVIRSGACIMFPTLFLRIRRVDIVATTLELGQSYLLPFFVHHVDFTLEGLSGVATLEVPRIT